MLRDVSLSDNRSKHVPALHLSPRATDMTSLGSAMTSHTYRGIDIFFLVEFADKDCIYNILIDLEKKYESIRQIMNTIRSHLVQQ